MASRANQAVTREFYATRAWRALVAQAKERDGYRCRVCGALGREVGGRAVLTGAHRIPYRQRPDLGLVLSNVRTLCRPCHGREDGGRRYTRGRRY